MVRPMSFMPEAAIAAIVSFAAVSNSASESCVGRKRSMMAISARYFSASSGRPPCS
jgi:hypothetical protein